MSGYAIRVYFDKDLEIFDFSKVFENNGQVSPFVTRTSLVFSVNQFITDKDYHPLPCEKENENFNQ